MTERYFKVGAIPQIVRQKSVRDSKRNLLYVGRAFLQYKDYLNLDGLLKETSEKVKNCFYGWVKGNQSIVLKRNDIGDWKIEEEKISYDSKNLPYIKVRVTSDNHENLTDEERNLLVATLDFERTVQSAFDNRATDLVANYAYDLCQSVNTFYHNCPILRDDVDDATRTHRLQIARIARDTLAATIDLMGLKIPDEM